jgi:hypothetical protein
MGNEIYTDLDNEEFNNKNGTLRIEIIENLVKQYPNDFALGTKVREYIKSNEKSKTNFNL